MGTTLTGKRVQNTYDSLLKLSDNDNLTGTAKIVGDGLGNDSPIYLSTSKIGIGVSPTYQFQTSGDGKFGGSLIIAGDLTVNGTTTIVDSTIVAIGDNMIEMAKDNTANTMDIGWYGTIVESGTKYVGTYYDAGSGVTTPTFYIGLGTTEPSSTAAWTTKGKLVIGQLDATGGTITGNLSVTGTIADSDGDVGTSGQILSSTGSGTDWIDLASDTAERIEITVKNVSGASLSKGTVIHASPTASPPSGNVIEVIAADYDDTSKMPAIGVLNETLANEAEGAAVMIGAVSGIDTSAFNIGDEIYVGNNGAFTNTKPTATTQLIQKMAVVIKSHASNGLIKVFGAGRSNDVPNEVDRDLSIAGDLTVDDTINVESSTGYGNIEIGGPSGGYIDLKAPFSDDYDIRIITSSGGNEITTASGDLKINTGNTLALTLDGTTQDATFEGKLTAKDDITLNNSSPEIYLLTGASHYNWMVAAQENVNGAFEITPSNSVGTGGTFNTPAFRLDASTRNATFAGEILVPSGDFISWGTSGYSAIEGSTVSNNLKLRTNNTIALTLDSSQNATFAGDLSAGQGTFVRGSDGYSLRLDSANSSTDNDLRFAKGGTDYGAIQTGSGDNFEFYVHNGTSWLQSIYIERANGNVNFNYAINSIGNSGGMYFYNTGSGHGVIETMSGKDLNILSGSGNIYVKDNLHLDTGSASTMLKFHDDAATRKISLFQGADNDYQFYGFGIESATLVYSTYTTSDDHVFFAGTSSTTRDELARIKGDGTIRLSQYGSGSFTGTSAYNLAVDSSGNIIETDGDVIDGSGTANYVAKWIDSNTLGNTIIYEDGSKVGINVTPTGILDVKAANAYSRFFSYNASAYTFISIGRTASELEIGVAAAANQFFTGASAGDGVIKSPSAKLHLGYSSGSPAITIDNNNVGIGSTSWSGGYKLYVTGGPTFVSNYLSLGNNSYIRADVANELRFQSGATATTFYNAGNSSELMRISNTGYFSVGTQSSSGRVTIEDTGDVEYLTLNTTATTNKRVRLQFTQNDNAGIEIGIDYSVNNSKNMYFYDRDYGGSAWLFTSRTTNWFQGKLGVGFTNGPSTELHVAGSTGLTGFGNCMIMVEDSSDDYSGIIFKGSTNYNAAIRTENGTALTFWQNGGTGTSWNKRMTLNSSGQLVANADGTATAPRFTFGTSTRTGLYLIGSDRMAWASGGGWNFNIFGSTGGGFAEFNPTYVSRVLFPSGSQATPGINGYSDQDTGIYWTDNNHLNISCGNNTTVEFQDNANKISIGSTNHNWFPYVDGKNYYSSDEHIFRSASHSNEFIHMYQNNVYPFRWRRTSSDIQGKLYTDSAGAGIGATDLNYAGMYMVPNNSIDWRINGSVKLKLAASGDVTVGSGKLAIRDTTFGYSSAYKVVQYGTCTTTSAISLGYDPIGNASGGFTGDEILIPNNKRILAPNAADNSYYGVMIFDSNNKLLLGSSNYLIENNFIMALDPATSRVGIKTSSPFSTLDIKHGTNNRAVFSDSSSYGGNVLIGLNDGGGEIGFGIAGSTISFYSNVSRKAKITTAGVTFTPLATGSASGDYTNVANYPYKVDSSVNSSDYWRIPHVSGYSTISGVYNYETGKNVYWGEPADTGTYFFRGRTLQVDSNTQTALNVDTSTTALSMHLGSSTQTVYTNIEIYTNNGNAQIWKAGTGYTSYGGAGALNVYNSNGQICFHPQGTANTVKMSSNGPGLLVDGQSYADNGSGGYGEGNVVAYSEGSQQATLIAEHGADGFANLNLGSNVSGRKFWHLSKRTSTYGHRLEYYYYAAGFSSRFCFFTNGDFHSSGDIVAYSTTISDASLKDNVVTIDNALDKVKQLRGVTYKWNSGPRNQQKDLGVIAQEVEKVFPEIVYEKQALYHGDKQVKSVDYEKLTAVLIESVKELSAKVEALENRKCNCNCK